MHFGTAGSGAWAADRQTALERRDEWGREVKKGRYLFYTRKGNRVLVEPCGSREAVPRAASVYFQEQATRPIRRLAMNVDSDLHVSANEKLAVGQVPQDLHQLILREQVAEERGSSMVAGIEVLGIVWECADPNGPGIPEQQTLERLVSAAIDEAYPGRGASVARWLEDPPLGDPHSAKAHGLSYSAKWYSSHGTEDFYSHVWRDERVAAALESRLRETGAWAVAEKLVVL